MDYQKTTNVLTAGLNDDGKSLELLKKVLTDNGFKHTPTAARVMLTEMNLQEDAKLYYETVAIKLEENNEAN